ncbi:MAG: SbcC/MukB-like Walker B domain-containing protein, partial [Bacteroidales bacterium]
DSARLTQDIQEVENKLNAEKQQLIESQLTLRNHSLNLTKRAYIATEIEKSRQIAGEWSKLNEAFGAQNGDKFRKIAMSFTLDLLLSHANHYLRLINDRYQLVRSTDTLQLNVIDTYMADEVRNVASLSGGETFIVSLALALGLSSLASNKLHIETLFIDEGFGSLDSETLQMAMSALSALQEMGRKVGVISHVPEMNEQIYPQIRICPVNSGLSQISIVEY